MNRKHGTGTVTKKGYIRLWEGGRDGRFIMEHIKKAEDALGKKLPIGTIVHHVNENRSDNSNNNLVICQNQSYHQLLHRRMRALAACGNSDWRKCNRCGEHDDPTNMIISSRDAAVHRSCKKERDRNYRLRCQDGR